MVFGLTHKSIEILSRLCEIIQSVRSLINRITKGNEVKSSYQKNLRFKPLATLLVIFLLRLLLTIRERS